MDKKNSYLTRYILSFLIATTLFVGIFLSAYYFSYITYKSVDKENTLIQRYLSDLDNIIKNKSCTDYYLNDASEKLDEVGSKVDLLERRFGKFDSRVLEQKKQYNELEYKHFMIIKQLKEVCAASFITIKYFYSQNVDERDINERTGFILQTFKRDSNDNIMIYSFDTSLNSGFMNNLKELYSINKTPIIIVNDKDMIELRHINQIDGYLE